jgi:catechol 2,3-dioxygenase-like lactoylglutathione lyase family enzyme
VRIEAIDHVVLPVPSLDAAGPFERLGLRLTPPVRRPALGTENRAGFAGGADNLFHVELLARADPDAARAHPFGETLGRWFEEAPKLAAVVLRVADLAAALADLAGAGLKVEAREIRTDDGQKLCDIALLPVAEQAATTIVLVEFAQSQSEIFARVGPMTEHPLPLKRLDHLAAIAPDLNRVTRFWVETLGVPVWGEIKTPTTIIRQMKMGDAIFELLGPATADSPMRQRPPGLISMVAMEVADLQAAVTQARAADFTAPDPAPGPLPGTRTASIPAAELSGLTLQLLEYV